MFRCCTLLTICLTLCSAHATLAAPVTEGCLVGQRAPDFQLQDIHGADFSLAAAGEHKLVVVAFLGTECPLVVNLYSGRLQKIASDFREKGVRVVGIFSNVQDSLQDIQAFAERQQLTFPLLKDGDGSIVEAYGATRTPEVFLLDKQGIVRYQGRVDDQGQVGFIRKEPDRGDLVAAIQETLDSQSVSLPHLPAVGCLIGRARPRRRTPR